MKETSGVKNPIDKTIFLNIYLLNVSLRVNYPIDNQLSN